MKKLYFIILFFITIALNIKAQQWVWAQEVGQPFLSNAKGPQVRTNSAGDLFAAGTFENSATLGDTTFTSSRGTYVARFNNSNQLQWAQLIAGSNTFLLDISVDKNNNTYILGLFANDLIFSDETITNTSGYESFIAAFNSNGQKIWVKRYPASVIPAYITNDENNQLIYVNASTDTNPVLRMHKITPDGTEIWSRTDSCDCIITGLKPDNQNNFYITATFTGNHFNLGNTNYYNENGYSESTSLIKLNTSNNTMDVEIIRGARILDIDLDNQNNIYLLGAYDDSMKVRQFTFAIPPACLPPVNCEEYFLAKLNTGGTASWAFKKKSPEPLTIETITVANNGNLYIAGGFKNSLTFDGVTLTESQNRYAAYIFKFNNNGTAQWAGKNSGDDITDAFITDITYSESQSIYVNGNYHNNGRDIWFGSDTLGSTGVKTHIFLAEMADNQIIGIEQIQAKAQTCEIMPNPSQGIFNICVSEKYLQARISIYDILGNSILSTTITSFNQIIDVSNQPPGIYFIELMTENEKRIKKFVLQ